MLEEMEEKKHEFKDSFGQFNTGSITSQQKAIQKLKDYGLKNNKLIGRLKLIDDIDAKKKQEEEERLKKAKEDAQGGY